MIQKILSSLRAYDWLLNSVVFVLVVVGLAAIYSVDLSRGKNLIYFPTQMIALGIGVIGMVLASNLHITVYKKYSRYIYFFSILLLVGVLLFGVTVSGTTGWYRIGNISFQPVEFAKIGLVLILGLLITKTARQFDKFKFFFASGFLTFLLVVLVVLQPDLGSALILFGTWVGYLFFTGVKKRYIVLLLAALVGVFVFSWFFLFEDYQKERLLTFVNTQRDPLGSGYNLRQSIIAIGSGGLFGRGLGFGSQSQLKFLPEAHTDFIFSVIAEELGFVGTLLVVIPFGVLLWRLVEIAYDTRDEFGAYVVFGIAVLFMLQFLLNVGSAVGLLPITGVTIPFVSYGGSSLIISLFLIGIVQSMKKSTK